MDSLPIDLPLKDIHLPPAVSWWPPAPGWWLAPLFAAVFAFVAHRLWRHWRRPTLRRIGLRDLAILEADPKLGPQQKAQQLSILLRRVALSAYPREQVAGLNGRAWLQWLDGLLADGRFVDGPGRVLEDAPYRPEQPLAVQLDALFSLCREWLHRLPSRN